MRTPFDFALDLETPVSAYLKLAPLAPRFLLEAAPRRGRAAPPALLGFGPADELVLDARGLHVNGACVATPRTAAELLAALRAALAAAPALEGPEELLFRGGLVGVLAFDLARRFERLPPARADGGPELRLVAPRAVLALDTARHTAALLAAGGCAERAALAREVRRLLAGPLPAPRRTGHIEPPRAGVARADFLARVRRAQEAIRDGEAYQLVLSSAFGGRGQLDPRALYRVLRRVSPARYAALFEFDDLAVVSASPEALVHLEHGRASLQPIAGTRPRGADEREDEALASELLADPKEAAEHVMLVDLARNDLGRVARPGTIALEPYRALERHSHVMHLESGVHGELAHGADAFDCLAACFPAGTVVGAPKRRALELLEELEPEPRGLYGGTFGRFGRGGALEQALTIRTLTLTGDEYRFQAGAGIVADSVPEREHDEILAKGAALRQALALVAEGA
jgi:anthranilate synthase component 1